MRGVERLSRNALFALWLAACGAGAEEEEEAAEPPPAPTCVVERARLSDTRTLRGVLDAPPDARASIAAEVAGRVRRLLVREGERVEVGTLLAEIDPGPAADQHAQARAHLAEADTLVRAQRTARDHLAHLVERGIAPRAQLEEADARLAALEQSSTAARAVSSETSRGVSRSHVTSPLAGVVLRLLRAPGETVDGTPVTPIVEIADTGALEVVAAVAPRDLLVLASGQAARVTVDGLPEPVPGAVHTVAPAIDPATGTGTVRITLTDLGRPLPVGLAAEAVIEVGAHDALVVPTEAVRRSADGTPEVLVCEDGETHAVGVEVGLREDGRVEITSGVDEHAIVALRAIGREEGASCEAPP